MEHDGKEGAPESRIIHSINRAPPIVLRSIPGCSRMRKEAGTRSTDAFFLFLFQIISSITLIHAQSYSSSSCPSGYYNSTLWPNLSSSSGPASLSLSICLPCPIGSFFNPNSSFPFSSPCLPCPFSTVSLSPASLSCSPCPSTSLFASPSSCICPSSFYLSRTLSSTSSIELLSCDEVPQGSEAEPGALVEQLETIPGWWRSSAASTLYFTCLQPQHCIGTVSLSASSLSFSSSSSSFTPDSQCSSSRTGPLCSVCLPFFIPPFCTSCPSSPASISLLTLFSPIEFFILLLFLLLVWKGEGWIVYDRRSPLIEVWEMEGKRKRWREYRERKGKGEKEERKRKKREEKMRLKQERSGTGGGGGSSGPASPPNELELGSLPTTTATTTAPSTPPIAPVSSPPELKEESHHYRLTPISPLDPTAASISAADAGTASSLHPPLLPHRTYTLTFTPSTLSSNSRASTTTITHSSRAGGGREELLKHIASQRAMNHLSFLVQQEGRFNDELVYRMTSQTASFYSEVPVRSSIVTQLKLVLGFLQVATSLILIPELPFPSYYRDLLSVLQFINLNYLPLQPLYCLFPSFFNYYNIILFNALIPLLFLLLFLLSFLFLYFLLQHLHYVDSYEQKKARLNLKLNGFKCLFFIVYLMIPNISGQLLSFFHCRLTNYTGEGDEYYLIRDVRNICFDSEWLSYSPAFLLLIVFYLFLLPFFLFVLLYLYSPRRFHTSILIALGSLYESYSSSHYYFELKELLYKLFLCVALQFISEWNKEWMARIGMLWVGVFIVYILIKEPYVRKGDDEMALLCGVHVYLLIFAAHILSLGESSFSPISSSSLLPSFVSSSSSSSSSSLDLHTDITLSIVFVACFGLLFFLFLYRLYRYSLQWRRESRRQKEIELERKRRRNEEEAEAIAAEEGLLQRKNTARTATGGGEGGRKGTVVDAASPATLLLGVAVPDNNPLYSGSVPSSASATPSQRQQQQQQQAERTAGTKEEMEIGGGMRGIRGGTMKRMEEEAPILARQDSSGDETPIETPGGGGGSREEEAGDDVTEAPPTATAL